MNIIILSLTANAILKQINIIYRIFMRFNRIRRLPYSILFISTLFISAYDGCFTVAQIGNIHNNNHEIMNRQPDSIPPGRKDIRDELAKLLRLRLKSDSLRMNRFLYILIPNSPRGFRHQILKSFYLYITNGKLGTTIR